MSKKFYVGNVSFNTTDSSIANLFGNYGDVISVKMITDRETGKPRGFCFVEMSDQVSSDTVIGSLNEYEFEGRKLIVNVAIEKERNTNYNNGFARNERPNYNRSNDYNRR